MADQDSTRLIASGARMLPEEVANRSFKSALRGLSESDVRTFLRRVADEMARMRTDEQSLRQRITELEERSRVPAQLSEQQLLDALGEETAKVLRSAQDAADEIRTKAEERAALVRREAQDDAKRQREDADLAAAARLAELDAEATQLREVAEQRIGALIADAETRAGEIRAEAEREADRIRARAVDVAEAHLEDARTSGREMVAEARTVRERILGDLVTRRDLLQAQIEELRTNRESLLAAYKVVKETLDSATSALKSVEARAANELVAEPADLPPLSFDASAELDAESEAKPFFYDQDAIALPSEAGLDLAAAEFAAALEPSETDEGVSPAASELVDLEADLAAVEAVMAPDAERDDALGEMASAATDLDEEPQPEGVDALFAKLRAAREEAVDEARHVLDDAPVGEPTAVAMVDDTVAPDPVDVIEAAVEVEEPAETPVPVIDLAATEASIGDDALRAAQQSAIDAAASALVRKAKRVLQDEQNDMLDQLRTAKRARKAETVLPERAERVEVWTTTLAPSVAAVYGAGWEMAGTDTPVPDVAPSALLGDLVDGLITPWRDRLAEAIDAEADGDVVTRVGARFRELRSQQLADAIRETLAAAYARGVYDALPDGAVLRWVPAEVGKCPDCDDNALEPVLKGSPFPTGQAFPPAHPGCRCLLGTLAPALGTRT